MDFIASTQTWITPTTASSAINGLSKSRFSPLSSRSTKNREKAGLATSNRAPISVVSMTNATAAPAPCSRLRANSRVLLRLPLGSKASPGLNMMQMPVKALSNSSIGILTLPRAGSLMRAFLPANPHSTTKWLKFQWMMQG